MEARRKKNRRVDAARLESTSVIMLVCALVNHEFKCPILKNNKFMNRLVAQTNLSGVIAHLVSCNLFSVVM